MENPLTREQAQEIVGAQMEAEIWGDDHAFGCDVFGDDAHLHVRRVGEEGAGVAGGRVALGVHGPFGAAAIFVGPAEARKIAEAVLTSADELDGATPLAFFPRFVDHDPDNPEMDTDRAEE